MSLFAESVFVRVEEDTLTYWGVFCLLSNFCEAMKSETLKMKMQECQEPLRAILGSFLSAVSSFFSSFVSSEEMLFDLSSLDSTSPKQTTLSAWCPSKRKQEKKSEYFLRLKIFTISPRLDEKSDLSWRSTGHLSQQRMWGKQHVDVWNNNRTWLFRRRFSFQWCCTKTLCNLIGQWQTKKTKEKSKMKIMFS